jgi:ABC-type antimicrobial peptide transport system permease subunit
VLSHVVFHRTREIGVRMALGADASHITRLVVKDGIRPVVEGLVIGLGAAAVIRMILQPSFRQAISPFDPVATMVAVIPLAIAAGAACYLPARRAARVDPNVALRQL